MMDFSQSSYSPQLRMRTDVVQKQGQVQSQKLSQNQIMSLNLLSLGSLDLRDAIYEAVEKNPALVISQDNFESGVTYAKSRKINDNIKYGNPSKSGENASDNFLSALESSVDNRKSLRSHLEHQFLSMKHSPSEESLGLKLINNLDKRGFHILSPSSLLDKNDLNHTEELLDKCLNQIQNLDPIGTCCKDSEESLLIQAKSHESVPKAVLFFLEGHLEFLYPPQVLKIKKKVDSYFSEQNELAFSKKMNSFSAEEIEEALNFIKKLDPFPARNFDVSECHFISPDVYVEKDSSLNKFNIRLSRELIPQLSISEKFEEEAKNRIRITKSTEKSEKLRSEHKFVMDSVRSAEAFIDCVQFREKTILKATKEIVRCQIEFFKKGPRYLVPLRQKDIAKKIGVHETTISRMANEKYLQCQWGLFDMGYFFTNAVGSDNNKKTDDTNSLRSKESIKYEIKQILSEHIDDNKPLSDQKIADILLSKGIKIARRTVAKYRSELNIDSSYVR
ncbi:MAG: RNA polymerase factor sigma-54 [Treponema sp.]|nr:RNA polymerase factor sigma-54 [Treponema sp.]